MKPYMFQTVVRSNFRPNRVISVWEHMGERSTEYWVPRVQNRKNFWYSLPRKKLGFHTEICEFRE